MPATSAKPFFTASEYLSNNQQRLATSQAFADYPADPLSFGLLDQAKLGHRCKVWNHTKKKLNVLRMYEI